MNGLIAVVDLETTGLDPLKDKVLEACWAFVDVATARVVDVHSRLFSAESNAAEAVNGLSPTLLTWGQTFSPIPLPISVDAVLAHNAAFDSAWGAFDVGLAPWVCTKADWEWPCIEGGKKLVEVALAHGVGVVSAHRAYSDVLTLCATLERAHEKVPLAEMLRKALVPRKKYAAQVSYDDREKAKAAGFSWESTPKLWTKRLTEDAAKALPFKVRELHPGST